MVTDPLVFIVNTYPFILESQMSVDYRTDIDNFIQKQSNNLFINAGAGCGKTTTIVHNYKQIKDPIMRIGFLAFNKSIADELKERGADASTLHSLGLKLLKERNPKIKVEIRKLDLLINRYDFNLQQKQFVKKIIGLMKNTLEMDIDLLINEYGVDLEPVDYSILMTIFNDSINDTKTIDFDDMIYFNAVPEKKQLFDILFVDESQDLNNAQLMFIKNISRRYIFVGDRYQSIYGFRGANTNAVNEIISTFNCTEKPLPVTWRCPIEHVQLINKMFPEIPFINGNGKNGQVIYPTKTNPYNHDEMVLCRTNAPLLGYAFSLIAEGTKATVRGRDIGAGLIKMIDKSRQTSIESFEAWLTDWYDKEKEKKFVNEDVLADKMECFRVLINNSNTISDLKNNIKDIFSDDKVGVVCSSVHKAKGLEAETVRIIKNESFNFFKTKASNQDAKDQERNIQYVAYTRSKKDLVIE